VTATSRFISALRDRAAAHPRRIVFPETVDDRTLSAVAALAAARIVEPVVVLDPLAPQTHAAVRAIGVECVDPLTDPRTDQVAARLLERRRSRGMTEEGSHTLARTPLYFADGLVALGHAAGCVAGAIHTTADVLRASLALVGPAPGVTTVSSAFYMVVPPFRGSETEVLTFADCAVVIEPSAEQVADIATAAARDRRRIVGDEPIVALLSYSTVGSGSGPSVERMRAAAALLRERSIGFIVDGELQGDAALAAAVCARKAPTSPVAGHANVLIFPTLDAGNLAYKLVERLAHAQAIGPIVQGLARPCSDLSRGAVADDIINVAAITALQADGSESEALTVSDVAAPPRGEGT
jgi:phosphate acetyltransferase